VKVGTRGEGGSQVSMRGEPRAGGGNKGRRWLET
jgi:hypothetical protein